MDAQALWRTVTDQLWALAEDAAAELVAQLPQLVPEPSAAGTLLEGRLLSEVDGLPDGNPLVKLLREITADLGAGTPVRLHGWRRAPDAGLGVALAVSDATGQAVLAVTPGAPVVDVVVTPGTQLAADWSAEPWTASIAVSAPQGWDAALAPGQAPAPPAGSATITATRSGPLTAGLSNGPGLRVDSARFVVSASPTEPAAVQVDLNKVTAAALPAPLARLLGAGAGTPMQPQDSQPITVTARADRAGGLTFPRTRLPRIDLPVKVDVPGVRTRGVALELTVEGTELRLGLVTSLAAGLPALPLHVSIDRTGIDLPVVLSPTGPGIGPDPGRLRELLPDGIGTELALPPVSGGGLVRRTADGGYAGLISVDLGVVALRATALFRPPGDGVPTSFLVVLAGQFPFPGLQLGLGFALDAVGGLVGINRRADVEALRGLVCDGNADRVLFPDDAVEHAGDVLDALGTAYPVAAGRFLVGPMLRITWTRMVSLSGGLVLEGPAPVQAVLVGRLLVTVPDPVVPLIRLQASVLGRLDPGVPVVELLVSLAGSWIVGLTVQGEIYLLVRGGQAPDFVLSAGGFHPRYVRPAGVPGLRRLAIDLAPGAGYGFRVEGYFALTANTVQFGGQLHLQAMIAGCGVEGWLGLDALFVFDPTFAFSVRIRAGVAVRAFGRRLAGVALDFTLEGPAPWHAFGTGSISVLFWDVDLDFDIGWGSAGGRALGGDDPTGPLRTAISRPAAWSAQRPATERTGLAFTAAARGELDAGRLVHPDATLQVRQSVLPLGVAIQLFGRRPVREQTWTIAEVRIGTTTYRAETLPPLTERFLRGEFFQQTEEQQLTAAASVERAAGVRMSGEQALLGSGHRVDDGYETAYEPEDQPRHDSAWPGSFRWEAVADVAAAERLERWRAPETMVQLRAPTLAVTTVTGLRPMLSDVSLVSATTDAWQAVQQTVGLPGSDLRVLEQWELPA